MHGLSYYQERRIRGLESAHEVRISVNRGKSEVRLEGNSDSLHAVVPVIYGVIMEVKDKEKTDRELELLAKQVFTLDPCHAICPLTNCMYARTERRKDSSGRGYYHIVTSTSKPAY